jgi:murein DD-endopeptidase MepM/ murein hydrolase activator NlpD
VKLRYAIIATLFLGAACAPAAAVPDAAPRATVPPTPASVALPIDGYAENRTIKRFGQYFHDRFTGYHVGDDVEVADKSVDVPVYAIADGTVRSVRWASGYGGVMVVAFPIDGMQVNAIYGHIRLASTTLKAGDAVQKGAQLALLGDDRSNETDLERKHLHFGMYEGTALRIGGYVQTKAELSQWIDPSKFFTDHGIAL